MNVKSWHPAQLAVFWVVIVAFGLPLWLGLTMLATWLTDRYPPQTWFPAIPVVLAFVVVFSVVSLGLGVTWHWLDSRPTRAGRAGK